jgi:NAD(P)-dependent dehydrogenase (short-subunit alcohol dehydrogenase family)
MTRIRTRGNEEGEVEATDETRPLGTEAFRLDGRVALVTGAASERGIGRAVARVFAAAGAAVALADVDSEGVEWAAEELRKTGAKAVALRMDVTSASSVEEGVAEMEATLGPADVLVNSAGVTRATPIWDLSVEEFDWLMGINVRGGFLCLKAVLPGMMERRWGRLIWLSSQAGKQGGGVFGKSHYAASKAALIGLCQAVARELGPYGITSNAIAPGLIDTGLVARSGGERMDRDLKEKVSSTVSLRRVGRPEEVAYAALYLASEEAGYVTGEILDVNGGAYFG